MIQRLDNLRDMISLLEKQALAIHTELRALPIKSWPASSDAETLCRHLRRAKQSAQEAGTNLAVEAAVAALPKRANNAAYEAAIAQAVKDRA